MRKCDENGDEAGALGTKIKGKVEKKRQQRKISSSSQKGAKGQWRRVTLLKPKF